MAPCSTGPHTPPPNQPSCNPQIPGHQGANQPRPGIGASPVSDAHPPKMVHTKRAQVLPFCLKRYHEALALSIKSERADRMARELAALTGESITEAVETALEGPLVQIHPVDESIALETLSGWRRFGKGRHPAALNNGDTLGYALARYLGQPLLFVGNDFAQTDVLPAL